MKKITLFLTILSVLYGYSQAPTTNAPDPTNAAADVISIFSGVYTDLSGVDYNPFWNQAGFGSANTAYDPGTGNIVLAYPNFNYQGIDWAGTPQDISGMDNLHVDIWIDGTFDPRVFVISSGAEIPHTITNPSPGTPSWVSVDIPVTGITGDPTSAIQFKFDSGNGTTDAIYVDNLYFWKVPVSPNDDASLSDLKVDGVTIAGFGSGVYSYTYQVPSGNPLPTVSATTTQGVASASITQASAVPGTATVDVTAGNGTTMQTYTVNFVPDPSPTTPAPVPTTPNGQVALSLFNDTPGYTNSYTAEGEFGVRSVVDLDNSSAVNEAIKMDFSVDSWGQYNNTTVDISSASYLNLNYYAPNVAPGSGGHEFYIMINSGSGEKFYTFKEAGQGGDGDIVFDSWQSVSIPLTHFTGFDPSTFLVWKLGTPSTAYTSLVFFDNIFFSQFALSVDQFELSDVSIYPNPSSDKWNIKSLTEEITSIQVYDILGKEVMTLKPNALETEIDNSKLNIGLYYAKLNTAVGSKTVKLIKD